MEEAILKYGKEVALFALCVYLIWSDNKSRKAYMELLVSVMNSKKENKEQKP